MKRVVDTEKVKQQYLHEKHRQYHESQFIEPRRSTVALCDFVAKTLNSSVSNISKAIDVGCGGGANIYHLSRILPKATWTGVDFAGKYFSIANRYFEDNKKYNLITGDFYELTEIFEPQLFDVAFSIQTLTWLPEYESAMEQIMAVTKKWIFVTSLFSEFNVDVKSNVYEYDREWTLKEDSPYNYNIYSLGRFRDFCLKYGAKEIIAEDFIIDIHLPEPDDMLMGTYTVETKNSEKLQFSGPLAMPWKMLAIRMN